MVLAEEGGGMRDKRRRRRRERERKRERLSQEFRASQERVEPCGYCGRGAGQVAMPDSARVVLHGPEAGPHLEGTPVFIETGPYAGLPVLTRPWSGGWGCRFCVDGLPGEYARDGAITTIRITTAPTREEVEAAKARGEMGRAAPEGPPSASLRWLEDNEI
jgi:hypothetical protein